MTPEQKKAIQVAVRSLEDALNDVGRSVHLNHDQVTMLPEGADKAAYVHSISVAVTIREQIA